MNDQFTGDDHAYEVHIYQRELTRIQKEINDKMLLNSTPNHSESGNSSQQPLLINTSSFNGENLEHCISISKDIEQQEQLRKIHRRLSHPTPLEATMTHEEIYECSYEDDRFLSALEYQNSLGTRQITDLDMSQSIEDAMKYFDEEVNVDSGLSRCDTPNKLPTTGTVAAAIANLQTQMSKSMGSPPPPYQEVVSPKTSKSHAESVMHTNNIRELRKRYEQNLVEEQTPKPQENVQKSKDQRRSAPPVLLTPAPKVQKSPKLSRKSKVKQMANMFNNKIVQLMRRESTEKKGYSSLNKSQFQSGKSQKKPSTKARAGLPIYRAGLPSPVPSPRFKRRPSQPVGSQQSSDSESACLVAEDVFRQLSVKDKALLYNKFIEDMSKQHPQFSVHARVVEANVQQELARTEPVMNPPKVKELARELEAKLNVPKPKISQWALKRLAKLQKSPEYDAANSRISPSPPPAIVAALRSLQEEEQANQADNLCAEGNDEEEVDAEELHVSTLTVVLKPSPDRSGKVPKQRDVPRPLPRKAREQRFLNDMRVIERTQKRNNESMRASISFEAYGPPRKIRRTRTERLQPKTIFQNAHMERLFYDWIMEKNGVVFDITTVENSEDSLCGNGDEVNTSKSSIKSKSKVHVLLEKAIAKLESVEARVMRRDSNGGKKMEKAMKIINEAREQKDADKSVIEVELCNSKTGTSSDDMKCEPPNRMQRKVKRQAPQPPTAASTSKNAEKAQERQELSSAVSSGKQSDAESESGLSSLPKITSDESQPEHAAPSATNCQKAIDFEFAKPNKLPRKKKLRRTLTWKKESCIIESRFVPSSTDSETEHKARAKPEDEEVVYVNVGQFAKKSPTSEQKKSQEIKEMAAAAQQAVDQEQEKAKLNQTLLNNMNSPHKIKSVYTLTHLSTPSKSTESEPLMTESDPEIMRRRVRHQTSLSSPAIVQALLQEKRTPEKSLNVDAPKTKKAPMKTPQEEDTLQKLLDSFIDLGFETGSNDMESPKRPTTAPVPKPRRSKGASPLFIKLTPDLEKTLQQNRSSFSSTPVRGLQNQSPHAFNSSISRHLQQQQALSPISTLNSSRRRSLQTDESRRSSIAMQVIREDRPLDKVDRSQTPHSPTVSDASFFGTSFNLNMTNNSEQHEKPSKFWVCAEDFTISLDVFYNPPDRLRLLYDIFCQKSCETRDLHFGIDDYKYSIHNPGDKADISTRLPAIKGCSHYWFSTGDLAVPFSGKHLAPEKIERLFNFINDSMTDKSQLRFGVDDYEFSSVPENWQSTPKFSMESSYSMLVGLQGSSNGLEGRSRFAWPNSVYDSTNSNSNSNSIKTSDLDYSLLGSEFDNNDLRQYTESPIGSNYFDVASEDNEDMIMPRSSNATMCDNFFKDKFDVESLDKLFEEDLKNSKNKTEEPNWSQSIPEMLQKLQQQKVKLKALEKRMKTYSNHSGIADATIPHSNESPHYMQKLRVIISAIDNIGRDNGFKACSMKQLESFMYFLTRYADICLASCDKHMNKVLDALLDQQQQQQQELIEANAELGGA
ncbi:PREDICTED: microtubule-associated protein futsch [Rhagoletis zephyria]|uniref:microtubule-associated protein futsch n=1 Tax=Rhagoletis zephyria TaxID=28612 RepID=UPI0008119A63|nr:PREDICTED: microtubule-associated protein futsch [Rhagoletis zephyria]XP_017468548.1 PREDICTED: microtubule-associated protein futsch [Rhagoletis zephyria]XP_017468549.1 PREDICTED: microtubule-associated protein futsch [Rhagoletis zephyria]XP_017468550.1 PREDICTED: microtubule-associated protein futsch [Rhagoletis zephyria]